MEDLEKKLTKEVRERVNEISKQTELEKVRTSAEQLINLMALKHIGEAAGGALDKFCKDLLAKQKVDGESIH